MPEDCFTLTDGYFRNYGRGMTEFYCSVCMGIKKMTALTGHEKGWQCATHVVDLHRERQRKSLDVQFSPSPIIHDYQEQYAEAERANRCASLNG